MTEGSSSTYLREKRVLGGNEVNVEDFPYVVAIDFFSEDEEVVYNAECTGTRIDTKWILTAAHCFDSRSQSRCIVRSGKFSYLEEDDRYSQPCVRVIIHDDYDIRTNEHDIALIEVNQTFNRPLDHSDTIQMFEADEIIADESSAFVLGYGFWGSDPYNLKNTKKLHAIMIPVMTSIQSSDIYKRPRGNRVNEYLLGPNIICAGYLGKKIQRDISLGDSGAPLIIKNKLAGIASSGINYDGIERYPGFYSKISAYRRWIDRNMNCYECYTTTPHIESNNIMIVPMSDRS